MDINTLMTLRRPVYQPLSQNLLRQFSSEAIAGWLSNRMVRENLLNIHVTITDIELDRNNLTDLKFFDSPHFNAYTDYITHDVLPQYIQYLSRTRPRPNVLTQRVLTYLISASVGQMSIPPDSAGYVLGDLFPRMKLIKESTQGNCYFCSVGHNVGADNIEVRNSIADAIIEDDSVGFIAKQYIQGCGNGKYVEQYRRDPIEFGYLFTELLRKPCTEGQRDCNECVWGGNEYDPYVANAYNRPLIPIEVNRSSSTANINIRQKYTDEDATLIERYLQIANNTPFRFTSNQSFILSISYIFPSYLYPNIQEAFLVDLGMPIAYMYRGNHFNAISFVDT